MAESTAGIGRAGEHYVAAELNRRGALAAPFSGNVQGIDIVATDEGRDHVAYIQVKTKREGGNWQVGLKHGWAKITPKGCRKRGKCRSDCTPLLEEEIAGKANHYWVFVSLLKAGGQRYWVVPDEIVRCRLVRELHLDYLLKNGGQRPGKNHDSQHHAFRDEDLRTWEDDWSKLGLQFSI